MKARMRHKRVWVAALALVLALAPLLVNHTGRAAGRVQTLGASRTRGPDANVWAERKSYGLDEGLAASAVRPGGSASYRAALPQRPQAPAATLTVTNTNDSGTGSLRQAITDANSQAGADTIEFNIPTSDPGYDPISGAWTITPTSALPSLTGDGTTVDGYSQSGALEATDTTSATLKIVIDGSTSGGNGFYISQADNMIIRGLVINNFSQGVAIYGSNATSNTVSGNYIGTDASGTADLGNTQHGVYIYGGAQNNAVGGDTPGERNVISGNDQYGVYIYGSNAMSNTVSGNYIGADANGTSDLGNTLHGVYIDGGAHNTVGGATAGERNVISGNDQYGVYIDGGAHNTVSGNYIGADASGATDLGNSTNGIYIWNGAQNNTVGGATEGERNVISGNGTDGVSIRGAGTTSNTVSGNYIGAAANGTADLGNGATGVNIYGGAQNNTVGGDTAGERNVISGNDSDGVRIFGSGTMSNTVSGNYIGAAANGTADLGNAGYGVYIYVGAQNNTVGPGNVIAHNDDDGVGVNGSSTSGNVIVQNSIYSNTMGIDLASGANGGIGAPVIVTNTVGSVNIVGAACANCTVEVFENSDTDGEGESYVGSATADASGDFTVTVSSLDNPYLTATATDVISGTSEFSAVFTATLPNLSTSTKSVNEATATPGDALTYTITLTNTGTADTTANVTDTLPANVTWASQFGASSGMPTWDGPNNRLLWSGPVNLGAPVVITYQVTVDAGVPDGTLITNTAIVDDGAGNVGETDPVTVTVAYETVYLPMVLRNH